MSAVLTDPGAIGPPDTIESLTADKAALTRELAAQTNALIAEVARGNAALQRVQDLEQELVTQREVAAQRESALLTENQSLVSQLDRIRVDHGVEITAAKEETRQALAQVTIANDIMAAGAAQVAKLLPGG